MNLHDAFRFKSVENTVLHLILPSLLLLSWLGCYSLAEILRIIRLGVYCGVNPLMHVLTESVQPKQFHLTKNLFR